MESTETYRGSFVKDPHPSDYLVTWIPRLTVITNFVSWLAEESSRPTRARARFLRSTTATVMRQTSKGTLSHADDWGTNLKINFPNFLEPCATSTESFRSILQARISQHRANAPFHPLVTKSRWLIARYHRTRIGIQRYFGNWFVNCTTNNQLRRSRVGREARWNERTVRSGTPCLQTHAIYISCSVTWHCRVLHVPSYQELGR